jgi:polyhydroxybutyrate depolymerase
MNPLILLFVTTTIFPTVSFAGTEVRTLAEWPDQPYLIYVPTNIETHPQIAAPVMFSLHGFLSNAEEQQLNTCANGTDNSASCLDKQADRENFIVVYPNGTKAGFGCRLPNRLCYPRIWRPTGGCSVKNGNESYEFSTPSRDNEYLAAVLTDIERSFKVDSKSIYFSGISNGAAMAFDISCQLPEKIAAVALVAGTGQLSETCSCLHGMRPHIIQFHGTTDPVWPYDAGKKFIHDLAKSAECDDSERTRHMPNSSRNDDTDVIEHSFQNCARGDLLHYEIVGGGHTWPGGFLYSATVGRVSRDINASELIWKFFQSHITTIH